MRGTAPKKEIPATLSRITGIGLKGSHRSAVPEGRSWKINLPAGHRYWHFCL